MNKKELKKEFLRLYSKYNIDTSEIDMLSEEQIAKRAKGFLANLSNQKISDFNKEDSKVVKDIYFYFG